MASGSRACSIGLTSDAGSWKDTHDPLAVSVYFSGGASSLRAMLADPNYGKKYRVVHALTDKYDEKSEKGVMLCVHNGIHVDILIPGNFYNNSGLNPEDKTSKKKYFAEAMKLTKIHLPELVCLSGFMRIVQEPLLSEYAGRTPRRSRPSICTRAGQGSGWSAATA